MYTTYTRHQTSHASTICSTRQAGTLGRKRCQERCSESRAPSENHESHQRYLLSKGCIIPKFWKCPEMSGHACPIKKNMIPMIPIQTVGDRSDFMRPTISVVPVTHDLCSLVEMDDILLKATWHSEEAGGQRTRFQTHFYWGMRHDTLTCWFNKIWDTHVCKQRCPILPSEAFHPFHSRHLMVTWIPFEPKKNGDLSGFTYIFNCLPWISVELPLMTW